MRWTVPFFALITLAVVGAFMPQTAPTVVGDPINSADTAWMLTASCLVLLMTPGLSFFYGGMVQRKNIISTMLQSIISMGVVSVLWVFVGFSLAFGDSIGGVIGDPRTFFFFREVGGATHPGLSPTVPLVLFAVFQLKFAIITPALITGAFAERVKFTSYIVFISLWSLLIYAPLAHMTWHPEGFLRTHGVLDFAGGTVVHLSAGIAAFVGASFLGARTSHAPSQSHEPASIPFVILGTGMLWFGWFGFNAGSALAANDVAAQAFLTTNTASAAAMLTWVFFDGMRGRKPSAIGACVGAVVGLVAITPAAGFVTVGASIFIGVAASIVSNFAVYWKSRSGLDDTLDVFPCHGVGGIVGMLLTAVFAKDVGLVFGGTTTLMWHVGTLIGVAVFVTAGSWILYKVSDAIIPLRVSEKEEEDGLDLSQHGESVGA
jgi:Amt family ammonium transporter